MFANLKIICLFLLIPFLQPACNNGVATNDPNAEYEEHDHAHSEADGHSHENEPSIFQNDVIVGAERFDMYLDRLKGKSVAMLVNQTSVIHNEHVVDRLLQEGINIKKIFAPEHGFRGKADAGAHVKSGIDVKTGLPLISLYGKKKKPGNADLAGIDVVVFDIQDVGARFYTYISSMAYVMEACAENDIEFLVLDRPNPNGHYVDGPVLQSSHQSFVGLHEIPIVHGMTVAEYAKMVNEEGWLKNRIKCNLSYVPCLNYDHTRYYELPIKPSPNLPNNRSILLYPSLCLFEGTVASIGRGTNTQFQVIGHPEFNEGDFYFTPQSMEGATNPKHKGKACRGWDLTYWDAVELQKEGALNLSYLVDFYNNFSDKDNFFLKNKFFDKLAGSTNLRLQIRNGMSWPEIKQSWDRDLFQFKQIRKRHLLYKDFE